MVPAMANNYSLILAKTTGWVASGDDGRQVHGRSAPNRPPVNFSMVAPMALYTSPIPPAPRGARILLRRILKLGRQVSLWRIAPMPSAQLRRTRARPTRSQTPAPGKCRSASPLPARRKTGRLPPGPIPGCTDARRWECRRAAGWNAPAATGRRYRRY